MSNASGKCVADALASREGTARVNTVLTGAMADEPVSRIQFNVGVPQPLMKAIISTHATEDAPSPLAELYWSWAAGYRHFVVNFAITNSAGDRGEGYVHIGSRGCGSGGVLALENKDQCDLLNTPSVDLAGFNPETDTIQVDISQLLAGLRFVTPIKSAEPPFELLGEAPGVRCHSSGTQADCEAVFRNLGLTLSTGAASSDTNNVFGF